MKIIETARRGVLTFLHCLRHARNDSTSSDSISSNLLDPLHPGHCPPPRGLVDSMLLVDCVRPTDHTQNPRIPRIPPLHRRPLRLELLVDPWDLEANY